MLFQGISRRSAILELPKRPLVDNGAVPGVVEDAGRYPRLEDEPSPEVDAANLLRAIVEA